MLFSSPFFCSVDTTSILSFRRHCVVVLFNPSSCFVKIIFFPLLIHLTGALCSLLKFFSPYQALHLFSTRVLSEIFLTSCSIHSIVLEAVCCWSLQVSSHLIKFLFNYFCFQSECCPKLFSHVPLLKQSVVNFVISVVYFSRNGLTFSRFFGFTHWSKKQLSFTSSLPLPVLSGAILDLGPRSSCSGGVL